jgi:hypothetical protein
MEESPACDILPGDPKCSFTRGTSACGLTLSSAGEDCTLGASLVAPFSDSLAVSLDAYESADVSSEPSTPTCLSSCGRRCCAPGGAGITVGLFASAFDSACSDCSCSVCVKPRFRPAALPEAAPFAKPAVQTNALLAIAAACLYDTSVTQCMSVPKLASE